MKYIATCLVSLLFSACLNATSIDEINKNIAAIERSCGGDGVTLVNDTKVLVVSFYTSMCSIYGLDVYASTYDDPGFNNGHNDFKNSIVMERVHHNLTLKKLLSRKEASIVTEKGISLEYTSDKVNKLISEDKSVIFKRFLNEKGFEYQELTVESLQKSPQGDELYGVFHRYSIIFKLKIGEGKKELSQYKQEALDTLNFLVDNILETDLESLNILERS